MGLCADNCTARECRSGGPLIRAQALAALAQRDAAARLAAIDRLAEIGFIVDANRVLERLGDTDPRVRNSAAAAVWQN